MPGFIYQETSKAGGADRVLGFEMEKELGAYQPFCLLNQTECHRCTRPAPPKPEQ
jgi:hypothetical protein